MKNVSGKLFSFFSGGSIGDQEREGVLVMKNVSVKLFSFFSGGIIGDHERVCQNFSFVNGGSIGDQEGSICELERVCQTLQLHKWGEYW